MAVTDLLTLDEARGAIRQPPADTSRDGDLVNLYIPAVTAPVEDVVGPVVTQSFTRLFDGGSGSIILLGHTNVTVTALTEFGTSLALNADYLVDQPAGIVRRGTQIAPRPFWPGRQTISITWSAGICADTGSVPPNIKLAARIILAHAWQADQQGFRPQFGAPDTSLASTPSGYLIPNRAMELLGSIDRLPGMA